MKLNSTIGLTLLLLISMVGAGVLSAVAGMSIGRDALKGVTQPDTRPTNNLANRKVDAPRTNQTAFLQEDKILASVKARISGKAVSAVNQGAEPVAKNAEPKDSGSTRFPMNSDSAGVSLQVKSVEQQGDALVMSVSLKNTNSDPVKFLYTFLEVKDEQGRTITANTEGLPSELPPDSEPYGGTIRMSIASVEKAKTVSLLLSDYPDQKVQLKLSNIPVTK